mmetsp:Transcript_23588/g.63477  ORF Transcript_23588/g.63477 Transcript_23588/m.63477 type:complete len:116 (+) Transcript_23588:158-505(+)
MFPVNWWFSASSTEWVRKRLREGRVNEKVEGPLPRAAVPWIGGKVSKLYIFKPLEWPLHPTAEEEVPGAKRRKSRSGPTSPEQYTVPLPQDPPAQLAFETLLFDHYEELQAAGDI